MVASGLARLVRPWTTGPVFESGGGVKRSIWRGKNVRRRGAIKGRLRRLPGVHEGGLVGGGFLVVSRYRAKDWCDKRHCPSHYRVEVQRRTEEKVECT